MLHRLLFVVVVFVLSLWTEAKKMFKKIKPIQSDEYNERKTNESENHVIT